MKVSVWFFYLFFTGNICDTDKRPQKKNHPENIDIKSFFQSNFPKPTLDLCRMFKVKFYCICLFYFVFSYHFQDGAEVKTSKDLRIYAMGRKRFLQIMKCQVSDSGMYTCDAGDAATSCTVEVYGTV